jgi:hypothetical protein
MVLPNPFYLLSPLLGLGATGGSGPTPGNGLPVAAGRRDDEGR